MASTATWLTVAAAVTAFVAIVVTAVVPTAIVFATVEITAVTAFVLAIVGTTAVFPIVTAAVGAGATIDRVAAWVAAWVASCVEIVVPTALGEPFRAIAVGVAALLVDKLMASTTPAINATANAPKAARATKNSLLRLRRGIIGHLC